MGVQSNPPKTSLNNTIQRKKDALILAQLIYECYFDVRVDDNIGPGRKHAKKKY
jgi:hypothetical protein